MRKISNQTRPWVAVKSRNLHGMTKTRSKTSPQSSATRMPPHNNKAKIWYLFFGIFKKFIANKKEQGILCQRSKSKELLWGK